MRSGLVIAVAFAVMTVGSEAAADPTARAEAAFRAAQQHFEDGQFTIALEKYKEAYALAPLPAILFNIAQSHRNLGNYAEAADNFRRYLRESPGAPNAAAVKRAIEQLEVLGEAGRHFAAQLYERALERYRDAAKMEALPTIHRDIGRTLERLGRYDEAIASYQRYLEAEPGAEDTAAIEEDIARLDREIAGPGIGDRSPDDGDRPIYRRWWFWGGIAAVVLGGVTVVALSSGVPGSDLGNVGFGQ
jgi:tetratricopeptide (TPR) repeat protein